MLIEINNWKLKGYWINETCLFDYASIDKVNGITNWIDASVPGSVHKDLQNANIIKDPYFELNSLECEWVENRWWAYRGRFTMPRERTFAQIILEGIDYEADIVINGILVSQHIGMYVPCVVRIDGVVDWGSENEILIVFKGIPIENSMYGFTSKTSTQKSRFNYKWDFSTRLVNIGLYAPVYIRLYDICSISSKNIRPIKQQNGWILNAEYELWGFREDYAQFTFEACGKSITQKTYISKGDNNISFSIDVDQPLLWFPNGQGEPQLYDVCLTLNYNNQITILDKCKTGFRQLAFVRTSNAKVEDLPYNAMINGKKIYLKGVNFVPLDHMYGTVSKDKYFNLLMKAKEANVNIIRVWGGGLIESEVFYDICDKLGIMVWQDFIQTSSSIEDVPSKDSKFLELLEKTATFVVKQKRNHVSLTYWCGGNELTDESLMFEKNRLIRNDKPADFSDKNIALLAAIVNKYDPDRLMLPTSASGPCMCLEKGKRGRLSDVHGPWKYQGPEEHYELFNESDSMLHSEMGTDGYSSLESIKKFISPANIGVYTVKENIVWRHHAEYWNTYEYREINLFGEFENSELEMLIKCSQFFQAESIRYIIESNRRRAFQNCGCIIWQFNEPFPNISCTNLVDYYGVEKLAYYFIKNSYKGFVPSLKYNKIIYKKGEIFKAGIYITNELGGKEFTIIANIKNVNSQVISQFIFKGYVEENTSILVGELIIDTSNFKSAFLIELCADYSEENTINEYLMFIKENEEEKLNKVIVSKYYDKLHKLYGMRV